MAPPRKHDTDRILDAARELALRDGPRAVSVAAISRHSGAPAGTLYHRFGSRDGVLAAAWQRALNRFHMRWIEAAQHANPVEAGVAMAVCVVTFAREHPEDARLLLDLRRRDLLDAEGDASDLNWPVTELITRLAQSLYGVAGERERERVLRALVDLPYAAVRRHRDLPNWLEADLASAARTLLAT
jgi:AcrR family transcriptional regulator